MTSDQGPRDKFECLLRLNALQARFAVGHDAVFARGLKRLFKRIPFQQVRDGLDSLLHELDRLSDTYRRLPTGPIELDWPKLDEVFLKHCRLLRSAYVQLVIINGRLHEKAQGQVYSLIEYDADLRAYNFHVQAFQSTGSLLNDLFTRGRDRSSR